MRITVVMACVLTLVSFSLAGAEPIAHYTLDDKEGDTVVDSASGKANGTAKNGPARVEGKIGGAFKFDGKDDYIEIPSNKALDEIQNGSFTISAWFKPDDAPAGTDDANNAQYGIVLKTGWHMGLHYTGEKKFTFAYFLKGDPDPSWVGTGAWDTEYEPGEWHHVVSVVDKAERVTKVYVNGELKGTSEAWAEGGAPREYGNMTWKIGVGSPGAEKWAWHAKGAIDDVRLYNVALKEEEVKALFDAANKK